MENKNDLTKIDKKEFWSIFFRSCTLDSAWNYERQQNLMYGFSMIPVLKRLYKDKTELSKALKRHLEFVSCTPHIVTLLMGILRSMEVENSKNKDFDSSSISAVRTSLMGPMAGIGDSFFWGTLLTIAIGVAVSFSNSGSIVGPLAFIFIINVPAFLARYYGLKYGIKYGSAIFSNIANSGILSDITKSASILGLMVIGAMVASIVNITIPFEIGVNESKQSIQSYIDGIIPSLLPALVFLLMYWILGKGIKTTRILIVLIILSCIGSYFGIV
ncbi:PTS system mannose/fructose/sorbose family transporter subunit IID [Brachyspira pilosicoli]|uniref:PTS system mannose/fructose/sorbose family transporter subunit IID n=1 Tax=Brachyspira pilosicoli TaxID=52584 RepID=UPI003003E135